MPISRLAPTLRLACLACALSATGGAADPTPIPELTPEPTVTVTVTATATATQTVTATPAATPRPPTDDEVKAYGQAHPELLPKSTPSPAVTVTETPKSTPGPTATVTKTPDPIVTTRNPTDADIAAYQARNQAPTLPGITFPTIPPIPTSASTTNPEVPQLAPTPTPTPKVEQASTDGSGAPPLIWAALGCALLLLIGNLFALTRRIWRRTRATWAQAARLIEMSRQENERIHRERKPSTPTYDDTTIPGQEK